MQYTRKDITPITEPLTIQICKESLYLPDDPDESLLNMYMITARRYVEDYAGVSLVPQQINVIHDDIMYNKIFIPIYTENNINVSFFDINGDCNEVNDDIIIVRHATPPYIINTKGWPITTSNILLKYTSTVSHDIEALKPIMLLIVGHLYENRQIVDTKMTSIHFLLQPFRKKYHV
jgi:hypothetical protein